MNLTKHHNVGAFSRPAIWTMAVIAAVVISSPLPAVAAQPTVGLGSTSNFAVLAGSAITVAGANGVTTVSGSAGSDMGSHPTGTFTGAENVVTEGTIYSAAESIVEVAKTDLVTAYDDAAGRIPAETVTADLGGQTLVPGVYKSDSTLGLTGALTLDGGGDPNAVFIFQAGSSLTTASGSSVVLLDGTQACNVFWQLGESATFGTTTQFVGHVFALTSITANTGATFNGQLLARNGAVTLDNNTITNDLCAAVTPPTPPEDTTVDGGVLPDTGAIEWAAVFALGAAVLLVAAIIAATRFRRRA